MSSTSSSNAVLRKRSSEVYSWCRRYHTALSWSVVATAFIVSMVLGTIGFAKVGDVTMPFTTRLYLALQLLTMESGSLTDMPKVDWMLEVARWSGVVASLGAILNTLLAVFAQRIHRFLVRRMSHHTVVVGAGQAGAQLASELIADRHSVVIIEMDENNPAIAALVERGANEVIGDAREPETLEAAAVHDAEILVVVAGSDTRNLEILSTAGQVCRKRNPGAAPLRCYVHIVDERFERLHEKHSADDEALQLEISTFNRFANSARLLLGEEPLDRDRIVAGDERQVHLVIVDLSPLGEALLKQSLAIGHYANNVPLAVTVIDVSAARKEQSLLIRTPELHECAELTFIDGDCEQERIRQRVKELLSDPNKIVSVAFCSEDAQADLTRSINLIPLLTDFNNTVFINLAEDEHAITSLNLSQSELIRLIPFGNADTACSTGAILRHDLDILARSIHEAYVAKRKSDGDSEQQYPAMKPWEQLDSELRDMNRQQADHIPVKLRALGYHAVPTTTPANESVFQVNAEEIEALAKAEHQRWCASRRLSGWQYGDSRNDKARVHPDLVPWAQLSEPIREYDREPVRNLSKLLIEVGHTVVPASP